jgi:small GTP-binding protein
LNEEEYLLKLVAIGSGNVGKTSIIRRYAEGKFSVNYLPTLGVDITTKTIQVEDKQVKLILVDTAGQEFFGKLRPSYYKGASGCLVMFALDDKKSFEAVPGWITEFRKNIPDKNVILALAGNKKDKVDERVVSEDEAKEAAQKEGIAYYETSAMFGSPEIDEIFLHLASKILEERES